METEKDKKIAREIVNFFYKQGEAADTARREMFPELYNPRR